MRGCGWALGFLAVAASLVPNEAAGCGDKFLVIGRGAGRVQKARNPATIALYLRTGSALPALARQMHLEKTLKQAGHRVTSVVEEAALRERMASRQLDFVIADLADARILAQESTGDRPLVVPVAPGDAEKADKAAYPGYPLVIHAGKSRSYLSALEAAMVRRPGAAASSIK